MRLRGDPRVRSRVEALLRAGEAAWCAMVRLEIWAGVGDERERRVLREYESVVPELPIDERTWLDAFAIARRARDAGKTVPPSDVLIFACARRNGVEVEHADAHFDMLVSLESDEVRP